MFVCVCVRERFSSRFWTGELWKGESHFVSSQHDGWLLNLLIDDQGNLEIVAHATLKASESSSRGPGCQIVKPQQLLMLSFDPKPTLLHIRSFWNQIFALICWFCNLSLNPQMFPSAVSNESLKGLRKLYPAPTARSIVVLACYVREQVQFPHVSNCLWQIWTSSTLLLFFEKSIYCHCGDVWETCVSF